LAILKKIHYFCSKAKNIGVFAFTYVLESFALFYGYFSMDLYSVDIDEVMKLGDEALNASSLQFCSSIKLFFASSLQFFLSVKLFIAIIFYEKTSFNTSSLLLFKRNSSFNASSPLLFKVTLPTSGLMYTDIIFYRLFLQSGGALPSFRLIGWMFSRISHKKV
jgi:hypothetical protein